MPRHRCQGWIHIVRFPCTDTIEVREKREGCQDAAAPITSNCGVLLKFDDNDDNDDDGDGDGDYATQCTRNRFLLVTSRWYHGGITLRRRSRLYVLRTNFHFIMSIYFSLSFSLSLSFFFIDQTTSVRNIFIFFFLLFLLFFLLLISHRRRTDSLRRVLLS